MLNHDLIFDEKFNLPLKKNDIEPLKEYFRKKRGWVYIAKSADNQFLKIGRTRKNPLERAKTLSSTGVFNHYEIIFSLPVYNQFRIEKNIHRKLKKYRVGKEFFSVNIEVAIQTFQQEYEEERILLSRFFDVNIVDGDLDLIEYALKD